MIEALEQNEATAEERNAQIEIAAQAAAAAEFTAKEKGAVAVAAERLVEQVLTEDSALPQEAKQSKRAKMRRRSSITGAAVSKVQAEAAAEEARLAKVHLLKLQQGQRMAALVGEGLVLLQNARKKKKFEKRWIVVEAETICTSRFAPLLSAAAPCLYTVCLRLFFSLSLSLILSLSFPTHPSLASTLLLYRHSARRSNLSEKRIHEGDVRCAQKSAEGSARAVDGARGTP